MAHSAVIGGASGVGDLQALLQIAQGQPIALDVATADRIRKESPSPKEFKPEALDISSSESVDDTLTTIETRASVLCRLISLANGSTKLRPAVVQFFVDLLNSGINVQLSYAAADATPLQQMANAAAGAGLVVQDGISAQLSETLLQQSLSAPGLSQQERSVIQSGQWVTLGVAAVTVQSTRQLLGAATAVAALSAEALQTQVSFLACQRRFTPFV